VLTAAFVADAGWTFVTSTEIYNELRYARPSGKARARAPVLAGGSGGGSREGARRGASARGGELAPGLGSRKEDVPRAADSGVAGGGWIGARRGAALQGSRSWARSRKDDVPCAADSGVAGGG
jgi:hypothetical protein